MSRLQHVPADQRAVLSLLLRQRKSYAEIGEMLSISEQAVHDRAHAALALLAPASARELDAAHREQVGEYMLGQQPLAQSEATYSYLEQTPAARRWAQDLYDELSDLAPSALPRVPPGGSMRRPRPSSRAGGAVLLGAIMVVVVVAVVLVATKGKSSSPPSSAGVSTTSTTSSKTSGASPKVESQINLTAGEAGGNAVGVSYVLSEGSQRAFYLEAEHLAKTEGFFYAVWLQTASGEARPLGKAPPVGSNGRLETAGGLPSDAGSFSEMLVTHETNEHATHPGPVVLRGKFSLH